MITRKVGKPAFRASWMNDTMMETQRNGQGNFITRDHKYVYLGGSLIALFGLSLWNSGTTPYSFLVEGEMAGTILAAVSWLFLLVSLLALLVKCSLILLMNLTDSIPKVQQIQSTGREKRKNAEYELALMEKELKQKLLELN